jgi:hypothetical protein
LFPLFARVALAARRLLVGEDIADPCGIGGKAFIVGGERSHARIADTVFPGETIRRRRAAHHLARDLLEAGLQLLRRVIGGASHLVHDLLEIDAGISFERGEQRRGEWRMAAHRAVQCEAAWNCDPVFGVIGVEN